MVHRVELLDAGPDASLNQWRSEHLLPTTHAWSLFPQGRVWLGAWATQTWQQIRQPVVIQAPLKHMSTLVMAPDSTCICRPLQAEASPSVRTEGPMTPLTLQALALYQQQPVPIAELAARCHVSERTLHRAFTQVYGCGPRQVLRAVRLRRVLHQRGVPRAVGAELFPYVDYSHFFREFVALTGLRPSQLQHLRQYGSPDPDWLNGT